MIGTRHGEKEYETLLTREEMARCTDLGQYFRVVADHRDLNYDAYFSQGSPALSHLADYNSDNARRLDEDGMTELLLSLDYIREELAHSLDLEPTAAWTLPSQAQPAF